MVYDVAAPARCLAVNVQPWRALLEHLVAHGLDRRAANRLVWYLGGEGTSVDSAVARTIAAMVSGVILPTMPHGSGLVLPALFAGFDHTVDDTPIFVREMSAEATLSRSWLEQFADLCTSSSGMGVLARDLEPQPGSGSGA